MYDDVPSWCNLLAMQSQYFADSSADPVACYRDAERLLDAQAKPADVASVGAEKDGERWTRAAPSFTVDRVEFGAPHKPAGARILPSRPVRLA